MSTIWIWWGISWNIPVVWFIIVTYPSFDLVFCFKSSLKPWCWIARHLINFKGVEGSSIALDWTLWQIVTRCFFKKFFLTSTSLGISVIWLKVYEIYSLKSKVCLVYMYLVLTLGLYRVFVYFWKLNHKWQNIESNLPTQ